MRSTFPTSALAFACLLAAATFVSIADATRSRLLGEGNDSADASGGTVQLSPTGAPCSCPDGQSCYQCTGTYKICRSGQCQAGDVGEYCITNSDCTTGLNCVYNICQGFQTQYCYSAGDDHCPCSTNAQCDSGFCNTANYQCQTLQCANQAYCSAVAPGTICKAPGYCFPN